MDLPAAIDLNKTALARIVAGLFALLGLQAGGVAGRISAELHRNILRALRPAESAVRRLIVMVAKTMKVTAPPAPPAPAGLVRAGQDKPRLAFQLFDSRQRFLPQSPAPKTARAQPRISFFADGEFRTAAWAQSSHQVAPPPPAGSKVDPASLARRLHALNAALGDLPRQARRLARALARRQSIPHLKFRGPLRPGHAPGFHRRPRLEVDHILRECDWLAREALPPGTSRPGDAIRPSDTS